jgi:hypothetical protein
MASGSRRGGPADPPADDASRVGVNDEGDADEACQSSAIALVERR